MLDSWALRALLIARALGREEPVGVETPSAYAAFAVRSNAMPADPQLGCVMLFPDPSKEYVVAVVGD
jgi:hypothetical protein